MSLSQIDIVYRGGGGLVTKQSLLFVRKIVQFCLRNNKENFDAMLFSQMKL